MTTENSSKRAITPPKGRPTPPRHQGTTRRRVFGSTAQWIAVAVLLVLIFVIIVLASDGSSLNPIR